MAGTLLDHLMDHLRGAAIVRRPGEAGAAAARPPLWRNPPNGTPAPGDAEGTTVDGLVIGAFIAGGIPAGEGEGFSRRRNVDLQYRSKVVPTIETTAAAVRRQLAPPSGDGGLEGAGIPGARFNWDMAGLRVIASSEWRELQPIGASADEVWTFVHAFTFELYA